MLQIFTLVCGGLTACLCRRFFLYYLKAKIMRIAFFIISLLFFLSWMIMSIIRADVWIAILAGVMVLISAAQLYLAFKAKRR